MYTVQLENIKPKNVGHLFTKVYYFQSRTTNTPIFVGQILTKVY